MHFSPGALHRLWRAFGFGGVFLLLAGASLLVSCTRSGPRADLVIINSVEPGSLDPATATGVEELRIVMALFEGLF